LLAAVEPNEIAGKAFGGFVVTAREVAFRALDFNNSRAGVGEAGGTVRRGDRLFERDDEKTSEWETGHGTVVARARPSFKRQRRSWRASRQNAAAVRMRAVPIVLGESSSKSISLIRGVVVRVLPADHHARGMVHR
jgi:hypothetical protein